MILLTCSVSIHSDIGIFQKYMINVNVSCNMLMLPQIKGLYSKINSQQLKLIRCLTWTNQTTWESWKTNRSPLGLCPMSLCEFKIDAVQGASSGVGVPEACFVYHFWTMEILFSCAITARCTGTFEYGCAIWEAASIDNPVKMIT